MKRMYGVVPAIITPFFENGSIHEQAIKEHCEFMVSAGVHGIFAVGSTGEFALMNEEERMRVAEIVVNAVGGRVPVYIHTGAVSTQSAIMLTKHAQSIGADGVAAVTPYYFGVSQEDMIEYYEQIAKSVKDDFPLYVYNIPGATGNELLPQTVKKLSEIPNIIGIKNSTADFTVNLEMIRAVPSDFDVVMGQELMFMYGLIAGVKGCISGIANAFPEVFIDIYNSMVSGDLMKAKQHQETFVRISKLLYINGKNLTYYKAAVEWRGFAMSYTRKPLYRMSAQVTENLYHDLDVLNTELNLTRGHK